MEKLDVLNKKIEHAQGIVDNLMHMLRNKNVAHEIKCKEPLSLCIMKAPSTISVLKDGGKLIVTIKNDDKITKVIDLEPLNNVKGILESNEDDRLLFYTDSNVYIVSITRVTSIAFLY